MNGMVYPWLKVITSLRSRWTKQESISTHVDGARPLYNEIWTAKVCIFAWRLAQDGLATQVNRKRRGMPHARYVEKRRNQDTM
jgi:hypothetical protein